MSHIKNIKIRNFRGIKELSQDFGNEKFILNSERFRLTV